MASTKLSRFGERVLSSTRISENSQLLNDDPGRLKSSKQRRSSRDHNPRRRLRLLDDDEEEDEEESVTAVEDRLSGIGGTNVIENDENVDPSLLSNALPSSIPFPTSSRLLSDEDESDDIEVGEKRNESRMAIFDEDDEYGDQQKIAPLSTRLRTQYDPRISVTERDRLAANRSPSINSVHSEPEEEEEEVQRSDDEQPVATDTQNDDVDIQALDRLRRLSKGAAKRTVKRPRPKIDPERLLSDRGLPELLKDIKQVQFKGRGHEFSDLDRLLFTYEVWANRLLAKSTFTEIIERLERVGSRREVQVALSRLRTGVWPPHLSAEYVNDSDSENGEELGREQTEIAQHPGEEDEDVAWERALRAMPVQTNEETQKLPQQPRGQSLSSNPPTDDSFSNLDETTYIVRPNSFESAPVPVSVSQDPPVPGPSTSILWTEEARVERNRRLALERLEAKRASASGFGFKLSQTPGLKATVGSTSILKNALKAALVTSVEQPGSSTTVPAEENTDNVQTNSPLASPATPTIDTVLDGAVLSQ